MLYPLIPFYLSLLLISFVSVSFLCSFPLFIYLSLSFPPLFSLFHLSFSLFFLSQVNGESVKGKTQSEAVNLLKSSGDQVTVVISRQEQVENQEEVTDDPSSLEMLPLVSSVGKTVMILDIPLTTGLAGLGVTVHGRCNSKKQNSNDMGIYIKSIVPGGAAARVILFVLNVVIGVLC
jgi:hypothetical protein